MSITQPVYVFVALGIQRVMPTRREFIGCLTRSNYFSTLSHKRHDFWKSLFNIKCVFRVPSTTFVSNIFHSKKN